MFGINETEKRPNLIVGLKNSGQNVCFFNSVIQLLYSVKGFRELVCQIENCSSPVLHLKQLFTAMKYSDTPLETYPFVASIELPNYDPTQRQQFDAQECFEYFDYVDKGLTENFSSTFLIFL